VPSASRQRAAQLTTVVCAKCAVFCAMDGVPRTAEEMCDCGRAGRTYVALTFALGSEPPPAIVRCVCGWWEVRLGGGLTLGSSRRRKAQDASRKKAWHLNQVYGDDDWLHNTTQRVNFTMQGTMQVDFRSDEDELLSL
jgi:hypothetical protein